MLNQLLDAATRQASAIESLASAAESIATIAALALAGIWTYLVFVQKRERYPRARTTHGLTLLGEVGDVKLLRATIKLENLGNVLVRLCEGMVCIQAVRPVPHSLTSAIMDGNALPRADKHEFAFPKLEQFDLDLEKEGYRIEPLEAEEFHFDFKLGSENEAVQVYSYFKNLSEQSREMGWNCTTIQIIPGGVENGKQASCTPLPRGRKGLLNHQSPDRVTGPTKAHHY